MHSDTRRNTARGHPQNATGRGAPLRERATTAGKWNLQLIRPADNQVLWQKTYEFPVHGGKLYGDIVPKLEVDTRGDLVKALELAGLKRPSAGSTSRKSAQSDNTATRVDQWLNEADLVTQYAAVRGASSDPRPRRGSRTAWRCRTRLRESRPTDTPLLEFADRSLHGALGFMPNDSSRTTRNTGWHGGIVPMRGLGGVRQHALADLAQLAEPAPGTEPAVPAWGRLVSAYCDCDRSARAQVAKESIANEPWSLVLQCLLARCEEDYYAMSPLLKRIAERCPTAYVTFVDAVHYSSASEASMLVATWGIRSFGRPVPQSLAKLPDLPSSVQSLVAAHVTSNESSAEDDSVDDSTKYSTVPKEVADRLRCAAGDGEASVSDPSWSVWPRFWKRSSSSRPCITACMMHT